MCRECMAMHGAIAPSLAIKPWLSYILARNWAMLGSLLWIKEINGEAAPDLVILNFDLSLRERLQVQTVTLCKTS